MQWNHLKTIENNSKATSVSNFVSLSITNITVIKSERFLLDTASFSSDNQNFFLQWPYNGKGWLNYH